MRPIEHLLIVAGPTACGKTTLIRSLLENDVPELKKAMGVEHLQWTPMTTQEVAAPSGGGLDRGILHYDFLWSYAGLNLDMSAGMAILSSILAGGPGRFTFPLFTPPARAARPSFPGGRAAA